MQKFFRFSIILSFLLVALIPLLFSVGLRGLLNVRLLSEYFMFDSLSFYLVILVVFLGGFSIMSLRSYLDYETIAFLSVSLVFTIFCFCVKHSIIFWCFYELSMLPLLYLIFRDSPYSERFIAG